MLADRHTARQTDTLSAILIVRFHNQAEITTDIQLIMLLLHKSIELAGLCRKINNRPHLCTQSINQSIKSFNFSRTELQNVTEHNVRSKIKTNSSST